MRTEDILSQIDTCLGDYDVGPDAMRCAPDGTATPTLVTIVVTVDAAAIQARLREVHDSLQRLAEAFVPATRNATKAMAEFQRALEARSRSDRHGRPAWRSPYGPARRRR